MGTQWGTSDKPLQHHPIVFRSSNFRKVSKGCLEICFRWKIKKIQIKIKKKTSLCINYQSWSFRTRYITRWQLVSVNITCVGHFSKGELNKIFISRKPHFIQTNCSWKGLTWNRKLSFVGTDQQHHSKWPVQSHLSTDRALIVLWKVGSFCTLKKIYLHAR